MAIKKIYLTKTVYGALECDLEFFYDPPKFNRIYFIKALNYERVNMANGWEEVVTCCEIFSTFIKNNFNSSTKLNVGNCSFSLYLGDHIPQLAMNVTTLNDTHDNEYEVIEENIVVFFSRAEVSIIYGILSRLINKCDLCDELDLR